MLHCVWRYPKLIGISVMDVCKVVSIAMSTLLSCFKHLSTNISSNNGCNWSRWTLSRLLLINDKATIMSDRFHYRTHKIQYRYGFRQFCITQWSSIYDSWLLGRHRQFIQYCAIMSDSIASHTSLETLITFDMFALYPWKSPLLPRTLFLFDSRRAFRVSISRRTVWR